MPSDFSPSALNALEMSATAAAAYLDACDAGACHVQLDPSYYQQCACVLQKILALADASLFPELLQHSAAARNAVESRAISHHIEVSRLGYYPELSLILQRAAT